VEEKGRTISSAANTAFNADVAGQKVMVAESLGMVLT
jgi:hypothetical protein